MRAFRLRVVIIFQERRTNIHKNMAIVSLFNFSSIFLFLSRTLILQSIIGFSSNASDHGFSVRLIHRDSPLSPFYNHSLTGFDRIQASALRSISRLNHFNSLITSYSSSTSSPREDISSRLIPDHSEYIMSFFIGTPPTQVHAIADTGSDFIWLQCPCKSCSHHSGDIRVAFEPYESSSYRSLPCDSSSGCDAIGKSRTCTNPHQTCDYSIAYMDGSTTKGTFSVDKFAFEDPQDSSNLVDVGSLKFGCSYETIGQFGPNQTGVVGLNRLPWSLISQLNIRKFSYCMVFPDDEGSGSRMYFGSQAVISGGQTPFLEGEDWFYYATVRGISIGDERVALPEGVFNKTDSGEGGFVIDSGTTYTMLRSEAYDTFIKALGEAVPLPQRKGPREWFELCFEGTFEDLDLGPDVTFQFDGAEVILTKQTTYVEVEAGLWCLSILRSNHSLSIFGNVQQQNYFVGYDLDEEVISFAPVDCAIF